MLWRLDRPSFSVWDSGKMVSFMAESISLRVWYFFDFFTTTNHFPEDSDKYVGSRSMT